jgi:transposase-like protein
MYTLAQPLREAQIAKQLRIVLFPGGIKCPRCSKRYSFKVAERYYCKKCRLKFSLKRCTPFAHSKLSFTKLWQVLGCFVGELSLEDTQLVTGLSHVTVRRWYRKFNALIPEQIHKLSGTVEIDEAFIGKEKFMNQTIVIGALERDRNQVVLECISNLEQGTTDRFILNTVKEYSMIYTDGWGGYQNLTEFFGYGHEWVNHSLGGFGLTNRIENVWMCLRRFIRKVYHHIWKEHLPDILREFQARRSNPAAFTNQLSFLTYVFQHG